jgi:hypothetical protein
LFRKKESVSEKEGRTFSSIKGQFTKLNFDIRTRATSVISAEAADTYLLLCSFTAEYKIKGMTTTSYSFYPNRSQSDSAVKWYKALLLW